MSDEFEVRKHEGKIWCRFLLEITKWAVWCNLLIAVNNTYAFTTNALQRDLGFNPDIFGVIIPLCFHLPATCKSFIDCVAPLVTVSHRFNFCKYFGG